MAGIGREFILVGNVTRNFSQSLHPWTFYYSSVVPYADLHSMPRFSLIFFFPTLLPISPFVRMSACTAFAPRPCFPRAALRRWLSAGRKPRKALTLKWGTPLMGDFGSKTPHWPDLTFLETVLVFQDLPSVSASQDWACISLRRIQTQVFWGKNMCCEIGPVQTHLSALLYGGTQFCFLNSWLFSFLGVSLVTPVVMLVNV